MAWISKIDQAIAPDLMQHVIEERDARVRLTQPAAIQIQANLHVRLAGGSVDLSLSCHPVAFNA